MQNKNELDLTTIEQIVLMNSLERDDLSKYMKSLVKVYEDSGRSSHDLQDQYNHVLFSKIEKDWTRLIVCTILISYVRSNGFDPCSLWVSIYSSGGHLSTRTA